MGSCNSTNTKQNKDISKYLQEEKKRLEQEIKLLLLGAGESGKSTIAKQMKIIHLKGFTKEERLTYKSIICNNVLGSMKALVQASSLLGITIEASSAADFITKFEYSNAFNQEVAENLKLLWQDKGIKQAFERQSEFQLEDSAAYYLNNIDKIASPDYIPDEEDVLRSRVRTTGIIETDFVVEKTKFKMVDVGGQRSERKKWMHCFQDVTAVIFCVALSEYDLKLFEDDQTNRMHESLKLFKEICNSKWFVETSIVLFLNKTDLFEQKILKVNLNICFKDYTGGNDPKVAREFIKEKFVSLNENPKKQIYSHFTCATDTGNVRVVFNIVKDIVLHKVLDESGLGF